MSDFLSRLVDRARGTISMVEPLIGSQFAPNADLLLTDSETAAGVRLPDSESSDAMRQSNSSEGAMESVPGNAPGSAPGGPPQPPMPALAAQESRRLAGVIDSGRPAPRRRVGRGGKVVTSAVREPVEPAARQSSLAVPVTPPTPALAAQGNRWLAGVIDSGRPAPRGRIDRGGRVVTPAVREPVDPASKGRVDRGGRVVTPAVREPVDPAPRGRIDRGEKVVTPAVREPVDPAPKGRVGRGEKIVTSAVREPVDPAPKGRVGRGEKIVTSAVRELVDPASKGRVGRGEKVVTPAVRELVDPASKGRVDRGGKVVTSAVREPVDPASKGRVGRGEKVVTSAVRDPVEPASEGGVGRGERVVTSEVPEPVEPAPRQSSLAEPVAPPPREEPPVGTRAPARMAPQSSPAPGNLPRGRRTDVDPENVSTPHIARAAVSPAADGERPQPQDGPGRPFRAAPPTPKGPTGAIESIAAGPDRRDMENTAGEPTLSSPNRRDGMASSGPAVPANRPATPAGTGATVRSDLESARNAPQVRVTIGRIEVRAVTPPKPQAPRTPAAPPKPRLSLTEYLRSFDEGSR